MSLFIMLVVAAFIHIQNTEYNGDVWCLLCVRGVTGGLYEAFELLSI